MWEAMISEGLTPAIQDLSRMPELLSEINASPGKTETKFDDALNVKFWSNLPAISVADITNEATDRQDKSLVSLIST